MFTLKCGKKLFNNDFNRGKCLDYLAIWLIESKKL